ncbi:hypothetical protein MJO10_33745, partial [Salmonella enterica subsp. enterica serovar Anatum]|nr:hypothetical protein [Salmonella enterica subsp. enterica serovar Anatum]
NNLDPELKAPQILVLAPTRELAVQVAEAMTDFSKHMRGVNVVVAQKFARELQKEGIYVTGFFYPVVPKGQARIRTQMSAAHTP